LSNANAGGKEKPVNGTLFNLAVALNSPAGPLPLLAGPVFPPGLFGDCFATLRLIHSLLGFASIEANGAVVD
jgi:hypothetical protein